MRGAQCVVVLTITDADRRLGLHALEACAFDLVHKPTAHATLGTEAAGVVESVGEGVTGFDLGDRVAYATGPTGAYAELATSSRASS
jgi:NADPH2:quinone reductase